MSFLGTSVSTHDSKTVTVDCKNKARNISEQQESIRLTLICYEIHNLSTYTPKNCQENSPCDQHLLLVLFWFGFCSINISSKCITALTKFGLLLSLGQLTAVLLFSAMTSLVPTHTT